MKGDAVMTVVQTGMMLVLMGAILGFFLNKTGLEDSNILYVGASGILLIGVATSPPNLGVSDFALYPLATVVMIIIFTTCVTILWSGIFKMFNNFMKRRRKITDE